MAFYAVEIQACPGFGFVGGPMFKTNIQDIASGSESRNAEWAICRHKYTAPFVNITDEAYLAIKAMFLIARGRNHTFLHKDWGDYRAEDEPFGTGDGTTTTFQLKKISTLAGTSATYERIITKPKSGVTVYVDGIETGASVSTTDGTV
jgi:uncharacterized protein (TIGR02217 family)